MLEDCTPGISPGFYSCGLGASSYSTLSAIASMFPDLLFSLQTQSLLPLPFHSWPDLSLLGSPASSLSGGSRGELGRFPWWVFPYGNPYQHLIIYWSLRHTLLFSVGFPGLYSGPNLGLPEISFPICQTPCYRCKMIPSSFLHNQLEGELLHHTRILCSMLFSLVKHCLWSLNSPYPDTPQDSYKCGFL